jgi:hypothetical protein
MKELALAYYAVIAVATITFLIMAPAVPNRPRPTPAECGVAEISPDMSARDREVCRQLRKHRHRM